MNKRIKYDPVYHPENKKEIMYYRSMDSYYSPRRNVAYQVFLFHNENTAIITRYGCEDAVIKIKASSLRSAKRQAKYHLEKFGVKFEKETRNRDN